MLKRYLYVLCAVAVLLSGCGEIMPVPKPVTITFVHPEDASG